MRDPRPSIRGSFVRVCEAPSSEYTKHPRPGIRSTFVRVCEGPSYEMKIQPEQFN